MKRMLLIIVSASALFAAASVPGCATLGAPKDVVPFRVDVDVAEATVWVDDRLIGGAAALAKDGTFLRVGFHRVEVRHPDYYSYFTEVTPKKGEPVLIHTQLHPLLQ